MWYLDFPAAPSSAWTPADLDCTEYWLDSQETSTLSLTGTSVDSWTDRINSVPFSATGTDRPTYDNTKGGGLGGVTFASDFLQCSGNTASCVAIIGVFEDGGFTSASAGSIYACDRNATSSTNGWFFGSHPFSGFSGDIAGMASGTSDAEYITTGSIASLPSGIRIFGAWQQSVLSDPGLFSFNGTQYTGTNSGNRKQINNSNIKIGSSKFGDYPYNGTICEIILLSCFLTDAQARLIEGYLAHKWALTADLPADHPYKSAAPGTNVTLTRTTTSGETRTIEGGSIRKSQI